jgi:predicted transcriptional regulator
MSEDNSEQLVTMTADIVAGYVANNLVSVNDIGALITKVHDALASLGGAPVVEEEVPLRPAVSVRSSIKPDHIVCLEDGKKLKMLKRHLMTDHGLTPADYRAKWNLPDSYPMVAPNYAEARRGLAVKIGLGRKKGEAAPARRGRRKAAPTEA